MAFNIKKVIKNEYEDPESMFTDNKKKKIKGLLSYQADIIRKYLEDAGTKSDVSLQLSTGAGKTLIGAVIGEWLLKTKNERILYLCPTNQLARQVGKQMSDFYGIENEVYTGSKHSYSPSMKTSYLNNEKICITSYSSLFNTNPYFTSSDIIIMDDVHQAEGYINNLWSVHIQRKYDNHEPIFEELITYLQYHLSKLDFARIIKFQNNGDDSVDKLPTNVWLNSLEEITKIIDTNINNTGETYSWEMIKDHLPACHFYYSAKEILIKPLYPPTFSFEPFSSARQRIYMSATLGDSGDLERIVGRRDIFQLPIPSQMEDRTIGRRFFCFPEVSLSDDQVLMYNKKISTLCNRSVYIVPSNPKADEIANFFSDIKDITILRSKDIEEDKSDFVNNSKCILILANRYDGIDFPDEECRMLFIDGLPKANNLQEAFYIQKLGLSNLYQARILTRITQAFGRSTRNSNDYSVVSVTGEDVINYLFRQEARQYLLPELRAEVEFGIDQTETTSLENTIENIELFLSQDEKWDEVDNHILSIRDQYKKEMLPDSVIFKSISENEIKYNESIWVGNYSEALSNCKSVLGKLTSPNLRGLRGIWNYYAGSSIYLLNSQGIDVGTMPEIYYAEASKAAVAVSWLHQLKHEKHKEYQNEEDVLSLCIVERLEQVLNNIGTRNAFKIEKMINGIITELSNDDSSIFEKAQKELGLLLGYDAGKIEDEGAPDPWWLVNENLGFVFEDYTEGLETSSVSVTKARQASTHDVWLKENLPINKDARIYTFLVGKVHKCSPASLAHLRNVGFISTEDFRYLADQGTKAIKTLWDSFRGPGDMFWRQEAVHTLEQAGLLPRNLIKRFNENIAAEILKS
ncbi:DEAD/DEAH box helicase family protein [Alkalispirochaeta alkalica]|uniref:DEAD/DEAH box helicase family protein n=1 Tax=Alkalispirochaeta alkalica TaxID=46356 RepID=UPI00039BB7FC|nr:DEAD/DEAH box helicase family protein [Alkalispirochaeta alkalica]